MLLMDPVHARLKVPFVICFIKKNPGFCVLIFVVLKISGAASDFFSALSRSAVVHQPAAGTAEPAHPADL